MEILLICGVFSEVHYDEVVSKTKTYVEYAANKFQKKIIDGFVDIGHKPIVLSAPFLGAYPRVYNDIIFKGFDKSVSDNSGYRYVNFINIFGIRNFSRENSLKKEVENFINIEDKEKLVVVYSPHTPFLRVANYIKRKDPSVRTCAIIPDLPQYMNLNKDISILYKVLKFFDVMCFKQQMKYIDSFVILTKYMHKKLNIGNRPYMVLEGIFDKWTDFYRNNNNLVNITYTGKLNKSFGIEKMITAFLMIKNDNYRLNICGSGEMASFVQAKATLDDRILYYGQIPPDKLKIVIDKTDVFINPRPNNSEYTKYSFPSKIIDYLSCRKKVVAFKLEGMPEVYRNFIYEIKQDSVESINKALMEAIKSSEEEHKIRVNATDCYFTNVIEKKRVAENIINMMLGK